MIVFLSGPHGVGKTTLVNNFNNDTTIIKIINIDLLETVSPIPYVNQLARLLKYYEILFSLPRDANILVDRYYGDANIYLPKDVEKEVAKLDERVKAFFGRVIVINVLEPMSVVLGNIRKRNRDGYKEEDNDYNIMIYKRFADLYEYNGFLTVEETEKYLHELF